MTDNNLQLEEDVQNYSPYLDRLDDPWGWDIVTKGISSFWSPNPGDKLVGVFLERREFQGKRDPFTSLLVLTRDGVVGVTETTILKDELHDLVKGELLYLIYLGEFDAKSGDKYKKYFIKRKKADITNNPGPVSTEKPSTTPKTTPVKEAKGPSKIDASLPEGGHSKQAQEHIKWLRNEMQTRKVEVNPDNILKFAEHNKETFDLTLEDIQGIERQLQLEQAIIKEKKKKQKLL